MTRPEETTDALAITCPACGALLLDRDGHELFRHRGRFPECIPEPKRLRHDVTIVTRPDETGPKNIAGILLDGVPVKGVQAIEVKAGARELTLVSVTFVADSITTGPEDDGDAS